MFRFLDQRRILVSKAMDRKRLWFCLVLLFAVVAEKSETAEPTTQNCYDDGTKIGVKPYTVAGGLCTHSTTKGAVIYGNEDLIKDKRADALSQRWEDTEYDKSWKLEVFPVMDGDQAVFGWYHVVLSGDPSTASIVIVMAVLDSDNYLRPPAADFVWTNAKGSCAQSSAMDANKVKFVPCNFAVDPLPFAGRIFVDVAKGNHRIPAKYDLNVKLIFPRCNLDKENKIIFRVMIIGKTDSAANVLRWGKTKQLTFTDRLKYVVAVDPVPPPDARYDCSKPNMPPYVIVSDVDKDKRVPKIIPGAQTCTTESCFSLHGWEGRCRPFPSSYVDWDYCCICEDVVKDTTGSVSDYYKDYLEQVKAATSECKGETNCSKYLTEREQNGEDVGSPIGKYIWGARKGHGVLMSVASFLVYPLSAYFARYYKETYMKTRAVINLHVWYAAHICGSFIVLSFVISGISVGIYGRLFYGHSRTLCGVAHRIFGWVGAGLFLVGMLTSGFRIAPIPIRKVTIFVHFLTGVLYQVLNLASLITCACIPGSPPGTLITDKGQAGAFPLFWLVTIVWLVFEIVMNILVSHQIRQADVSNEFMPRRTHVCGLIYMPSLMPDSTKDLVGRERRKFLLQIYIVGNSILTIVALVLIIYPDDKGRYLGIMELTHYLNGSNRFADNYDEYAELDDE